MPDREKVIRALELCRYDPAPGQEKKWYHSCLKCPYCTDSAGMEMNCAQMYTDAIALLWEQEPVKPILTLDGNGNLWRDCGKCGGVLPKHAQYCPTCGWKVKWE